MTQNCCKLTWTCFHWGVASPSGIGYWVIINGWRIMQPPVKRGPGKFETFWGYLASFKDFTLIIWYVVGLTVFTFFIIIIITLQNHSLLSNSTTMPLCRRCLAELNFYANAFQRNRRPYFHTSHLHLFIDDLPTLSGFIAFQKKFPGQILDFRGQ